jgi:hypothetical protein
MRRILSKKASVFDTYVVFIFLITVTLTAGIALFVSNTFNDAWQEQEAEQITQKSQELSDAYTGQMNVVLDGGILVWFTILWLGTLVTSAFLDTNPAWFIIFFFVSLTSYFLLLPFANIISDLSEQLPQGFDNLPITLHIINNLIYYITAYIVSIGVTLFVKTRYGQV